MNSIQETICFKLTILKMLLVFCASFEDWETWQNYPGNQVKAMCSLGIEVPGLTPAFEQLVVGFSAKKWKTAMHLLKFLYSIPTWIFPHNECKCNLGMCLKKCIVPIHIYDVLVACLLSLLKNKPIFPILKIRMDSLPVKMNYILANKNILNNLISLLAVLPWPGISLQLD